MENVRQVDSHETIGAIEPGGFSRSYADESIFEDFFD